MGMSRKVAFKGNLSVWENSWDEGHNGKSLPFQATASTQKSCLRTQWYSNAPCSWSNNWFVCSVAHKFQSKFGNLWYSWCICNEIIVLYEIPKAHLIFPPSFEKHLTECKSLKIECVVFFSSVFPERRSQPLN